MTKKFLVLFTALHFLLSIFYLDTWQNGNTTSRAIALLAFSESRTLQVDKYHERSVDKSYIDGHYYSDKAPLPLFITIPFYEMVTLFNLSPENREKAAYIVGGLLCGSIPFTLILLISFLFIRKQNDTLISPVLLSTLPFYASFIFIYSGTFYSHLLATLFLLIGYILIRYRKKFLLAGLLCGFAFASEFPVTILIAIWAFQIWFNEKSIAPAVKFSLGVLPSVLFIAVYNYFLTGNILNMSYKYHAMQDLHSGYGFSLPTLESIWGLTLSPYRGILFYTPFLLLVLYGSIKAVAQGSIRITPASFLSDYLIPASLASVLFMASYFEWWGGWCYGPRLIFFIAVLLTFEGIVFCSSTKFFKPLFWILMGFGLICTFMAKSTIVYSVPTEIQNPITEQVIPNFTAGNFNPNNLLTMLFDVPVQTANWIFFGLFVAITLLLAGMYNREKQIADAE